MNGFSERAKLWTAEPSPSETGESKSSSNNFGLSMNALSFGFVATAIFISMFLLMAFFEHLFRPRPGIIEHRNAAQGSLLVIGEPQDQPHSFLKIKKPESRAIQYASDVSVVMPGQQQPTFLAQPAPLPCPREGIHWPSHDHRGLVSP